MNSEHYLLDTSAMLTLIEDEAGADQVEYVLTQGHAILSWLVLLETYYVTYQEQGQAEANRRYALMKQLPVKFLWEVDEPIVLTAGRLKATQRISLADAIIAAFAIQHNAVLLHKDPEFETLADQVKLESLPYKGA